MATNDPEVHFMASDQAKVVVDPLALPVELWQAILDDVSDLDLVRFQDVSLYAHDIVWDSTPLRYRAEQFRLCTADGPASQDLTLDARLVAQKEWHKSWRSFGRSVATLHTFERGTYPEPYISASLFADPVASETANRGCFDTLRFIRLPSIRRGVGLQSWILDDLPEFERAPNIFAFDYDQDLLVILQKDEANSVRLIICTCSTGAVHPKTTSSLLGCLFDVEFYGFSCLRIHCAMVGWSYSMAGKGQRLFVWDWTHRRICLDVITCTMTEESHVKGFAFLDARHIIILFEKVAERQAILVVIDCYHDQEGSGAMYPSTSPYDPRIVASLCLPPRRRNRRPKPWASVNIECRPCSENAAPADDARFHWAPHDDIAVVTLLEDELWEHYSIHFHIIIPTHVLRSRLHAPTTMSQMQPVPWSEWGMHTHTIQTGWRSLGRDALCGSRLCAPAFTLCRLVLFDFAPADVFARHPEPEPDDPEFARYLRECRVYASFFDPPGKDWSALRAPFCATLTDFGSACAYMLAEDGLVLPYGQPQGAESDAEPSDSRLEIYTV
ncbi:hypothetical protein PsYK624_101480 [Phanerochaete sordida]|uniref:F-box domain-containing protein n=1 Tax=Phanerochaete sordida TaxID=48140 RepID=A0A9P3GFI1_9APHY|nr:hypothetical protein PsYK624_101480 [Phanerochaete sordida]